jgi:hypothetical protein
MHFINFFLYLISINVICVYIRIVSNNVKTKFLFNFNITKKEGKKENAHLRSTQKDSLCSLDDCLLSAVCCIIYSALQIERI